jgi:hypothetical protein
MESEEAVGTCKTKCAESLLLLVPKVSGFITDAHELRLYCKHTSEILHPGYHT